MKTNYNKTTSSQNFYAGNTRMNPVFESPQIHMSTSSERLIELQKEVNDLSLQRRLLLGSLAQDNEQLISLNHRASKLEETVKSLQKKVTQLSQENTLLKQQKYTVSQTEESNSILSSRHIDSRTGIITENRFTLHHKRQTCEIKNDGGNNSHKHIRTDFPSHS